MGESWEPTVSQVRKATLPSGRRSSEAVPPGSKSTARERGFPRNLGGLVVSAHGRYR